MIFVSVTSPRHNKRRAVFARLTTISRVLPGLMLDVGCWMLDVGCGCGCGSVCCMCILWENWNIMVRLMGSSSSLNSAHEAVWVLTIQIDILHFYVKPTPVLVICSSFSSLRPVNSMSSTKGLLGLSLSLSLLSPYLPLPRLNPPSTLFNHLQRREETVLQWL